MVADHAAGEPRGPWFGALLIGETTLAEWQAFFRREIARRQRDTACRSGDFDGSDLNAAYWASLRAYLLAIGLPPREIDLLAAMMVVFVVTVTADETLWQEHLDLLACHLAETAMEVRVDPRGRCVQVAFPARLTEH